MKIEGARYYANELRFIRPKGFLDQTFHVLNQPESVSDPFNIVISRNLLAKYTDTLVTLITHYGNQFSLLFYTYSI